MPFRPMLLRGTRVFARCRPDGELVVDDGKVEVRYKLNDGRLYSAAPRNLVPVDGPLVSDESAGEAKAVEKKPTEKKGAAKASGAAAPTKPKDGEVLVYADGACKGNPGPAGLGVVMIYDDVRRELSEYLGDGTNNIAELTAILRAAEGMPDSSRPLRLYTDSSYAIGVLSKGWKAKANQALIAEIKKALARLSDVELHYVPGHAGVALNERADTLAVEAVVRRGNSGWVTIDATPKPRP